MAKEKIEQPYDDAAVFIKANMKHVGGKDGEGKRYQVNQEKYNEFLEGRGITKDTLKQLSQAKIDYNDGTTVVLKDTLLAEKEDIKATINTRTSDGVISASMTRSLETRTPETGERHMKFGVVKIKQNLKSRMNTDLLDMCSKEIEEAMTK